MLARLFRYLFAAIVVALVVAGCDQKALLQKFVPKDDEALARRFLDAIRTGDYAAADEMLASSLRGVKSENGLHEVNRVLAHGEPVSVEIIGCNVFSNTSSQGAIRTTNLSYQIHFPDSWAAGNIAVGHQGGATSIVNAHFQPIPESLEVLNRFTFAGKSVVHYLVFAACVTIPLLILVALIVCIRSRIRRKWLWIIFILIGLVQFRFDWSIGHVYVQPISFALFGAGAFRSSPYAPWVLNFAIPVGAILFLVLRRRLLINDTTKETSPDDPANSEGFPSR